MKRLIFGCGYLGLRAAKIWLNKGDSVFAITRSEARSTQLEKLGIEPIVADVTRPETLNDLPTADTVLIAVGMDRSKYSDIRMVYVDGLKNVLNRLSDTTNHLVYISSTGVYGDHNGNWIDESTEPNPIREGGKACLEAETTIHSGPFKTRSTILRFAGIYGPDRVPTKTLIQSKDWSKLSASGYLNLIHVDDGAQIVDSISGHAPQGETFLVSDGSPPLRKEYYEFIAQHFGINHIPWEESKVDPTKSRSGSSKRIRNQKLLDYFDINFQYPDYKSGLRHCLEDADSKTEN